MAIPANKRPYFFEAFTAGATGAISALVLWPISYAAAASTSWHTGAAFLDFWLGALALATGLGAVIATVIGIVGLGAAVNILAK